MRYIESMRRQDVPVRNVSCARDTARRQRDERRAAGTASERRHCPARSVSIPAAASALYLFEARPKMKRVGRTIQPQTCDPRRLVVQTAR